MKKRLVVVVIDLKTGSAGFDEVLQRAHPTIYRLYTRYIYVNVFYNYLKRVNDILLVIMCVVCMRARNIMVRTFLFNIALWYCDWRVCVCLWIWLGYGEHKNVPAASSSDCEMYVISLYGRSYALQKKDYLKGI